MIELSDYLFVGAVMFACGIICAVSRKNTIGILMGIELILNAANINFVGFSRFTADPVAGQIFSLFVIVIAAAEAAVALSIVVRMFHNRQTVDIDDMSLLRR